MGLQILTQNSQNSRKMLGENRRIQGDQLRNKRFVRAEKLANEAPVKILFPVVVFIFPSVFIILIGPIVYQALRTLAR